MTYRIALAGNPNTGKSTVFNALTGLKQHTGNWAGKTVENISGRFTFGASSYEIFDLPGIYSLNPDTEDEAEASDFILSAMHDTIVIVLDASLLARNLLFCVELLQSGVKAVVCLNLIDEAKSKGIEIDVARLEVMLGTTVVCTNARRKKGITELKKAISESVTGIHNEFLIGVCPEEFAEELREKCINYTLPDANRKDRLLDTIVLSKVLGPVIMLACLFGVFWLTIYAANLPSELLESFFARIKIGLITALSAAHAPDIIIDAAVNGVYQTVATVVSVMLPPMAIFFPIFGILEDSGLLPRFAFNMDKLFQKAGTNGKNALTMCMGYGCNACAVTSCRIMSSKSDREKAIITNSLVPCNGKFPSLILLSGFFAAGAARGVVVFAMILISAGVTLVVTKILSILLYKGEKSSFLLELPPYRKPQILSTILLSLKDKTLKILLRAVIVSVPCGLLIWILQNVSFSGVSLLTTFCSALEPFGLTLGLDGVILAAFILGFPANEIVIPVMLLCYAGSGDIIGILVQNGWTIATAVCCCLFFMNHFPCGTALWTIKKEAGLKTALLAFSVPTLTGVILCLIVSFCFRFVL